MKIHRSCSLAPPSAPRSLFAVRWLLHRVYLAETLAAGLLEQTNGEIEIYYRK
jgi:hypothetical protein